MGDVHAFPMRARPSHAEAHRAALRSLVDQYDLQDPMTAVRIMGVAAQLYSATIGSDEEASAHLARIALAMLDIHADPEPAA